MSLLEDINALNDAARLQADYKLIDFEPALVPMLKPRGTDATFFKHIPDFSSIMSGYDTMVPAYMAFYKGQVICIFGGIPIWLGVGEWWRITDEAFPDHARAYNRESKL